jgi:ectoine hydroxylase-related dioxygenase (phytanoyl-CoA dioxygenase family)
VIHEVNARGYAIALDVVDSSTIDTILRALSGFDHVRSARRGEVFGVRDLLHIEQVRVLSKSDALSNLVTPIVGADARAVRGIFFDKTAGANWPVPWHQDLSLAVSEKRDIDGWGAWSLKNGVHHVQPPADVLAHMLTVRLHLDDCGPDNGPLKVRPGTHMMGRLTREAIDNTRGTIAEETCCVKKGAAVVMRPLLLHASSAATNPSHRRVIHLEYAPSNLLAHGMDWAFQ